MAEAGEIKEASRPISSQEIPISLVVKNEEGHVALDSIEGLEGFVIGAKIGHRRFSVSYDGNGKVSTLEFTPEYQPISRTRYRSYLGMATARLIHHKNSEKMIERIKSKKHIVSKRRDSIYHLDYEEDSQKVVVNRFDQGEHSDMIEIPLAISPSQLHQVSGGAEFQRLEELLGALGIKWERF